MKIILFLLVTLSFQFATAQSSEVSWLHGKWHGSGYQPNSAGQKDWLIDLSYQENTDSYTISYPTFPCSGNWTLVKFDNETAEFVERISVGDDLCANNMRVVVRYLKKNKISVTFYAPNSIIIDASGTLRRR